MYCPNCGQEQTTVETRFCSRCGYLLTGTADLLQIGGVLPTSSTTGHDKKLSARTRGLKQGLFIFLLTFLVVPIVAMITVALHAQPFGVAITAVLLFMGGLLRMAYALMFESAEVGQPTMEENLLSTARTVMGRTKGDRSLPPPAAQADFVSPATGNWRDTNDLQPASVTDNTTKLLENDQ